MKSFWYDLLYIFITVAVPLLTTYALKYLDKVSKEADIATEQSIVNDTINHALDIITRVVMTTSQTYVDSLKKAGKFDEESQRIAFQTTKDTIISLLNTESKELIETLYSDLDTWLTVQIESAVKNLKSNN